jgi:hypothetical protein
MQVIKATVTHYSVENPQSSVEIHDLKLSQTDITTRFRLPLGQRLIITRDLVTPSYAARVLIDGTMQDSFPEENWQTGQFTFRTKKPEKTIVITIFKERHLPGQ